MQLLRRSGQKAWVVAVIVSLCAVSLVSCRKSADPSNLGTFRMGEKIQIPGGLVYTVLEAQWKPSLTESGGGRPPKDRYLFVRVSVTNSGGSMQGIPPFQIKNTSKQNFMELTENMEDVSQYLGVMRMVQPAQTEQGYVVFDAPIAAYKLHISDGGEPGSEKFAVVDLPVMLE